jgi:chromosomal replication initiator protein
VQLIWEEFLKLIKEEAGSQVVETWFKAVKLHQWNPECQTALLQVPNQFVLNWIQEHYMPLVKTHLGRLLHVNELTCLLTCESEAQKQEGTSLARTILPASALPKKQNNLEKSSSSHTSLTVSPQNLPVKKIPRGRQRINPAYTFNTFVVGPSNSLAHAAAFAVSQNLGKVYNPLFIYGGTGLGKTHLLHAIGNEAKKTNPTLKLHYESSDKFMHEFISSIRFDKSHQFREKYQRADLLLIDDVQFFSKKEQTQEMFFHIFNTLYEQQKQIVLTSDTFPKEINGLQSRIKSRMEWGLVVDIQTPDLETKIAILQKKAASHDIELDDQVSNYIASRVNSNIRALEGALVRVEAFASLTHQPITIELAQRVLLHLNEPRQKENIALDAVLHTVARNLSISINEIRSKNRSKSVAAARQILFYLLKKHTLNSLQTIGSFVGGRDHSTVIHAISKVENIIETNEYMAKKIKIIEQDIISS